MDLRNTPLEKFAVTNQVQITIQNTVAQLDHTMPRENQYTTIPPYGPDVEIQDKSLLLATQGGKQNQLFHRHHRLS